MIEAHATARYVRTSAQKAGLVLDLIRGKDVNRALATLKFTRKVDRATTSRRCCGRRLPTRSSKDGFSGDVDRLFVSACYANQGPSQKRVRPAPMGRAFRVLKRTAHLTVHVSERPEKSRRAVRAPKRRAGRDEAGAKRAESEEGEGVTVGQKVHPFGFRLGFNKTWRSRWYSDRTTRSCCTRI